MASFGKTNPRTFWNYAVFPDRDFQGQGEPRMAAVFKNPGSFSWEGSILSQWEPYRVLSSVAEPWPADTRKVLWVFTHPVNASYTIQMVSSIYYHGPLASPTAPYYGREWTVKAFDGSTELASIFFQHIEPGWSAVTNSAGYQLEWRIGNEIVPGTWTRANMRFGGASWAEQPSFQPYRTRP